MSSPVEKYKHASVIKCVRSIQFDVAANSDQKHPLCIQEGVLLPTVHGNSTSYTQIFSCICGCCGTGRLKKELDEWVGGEDEWQESGIFQRIYVKVQPFTKCSTPFVPHSFDCQLHFNTLPCGGGGWECGGVCTDGGTQCKRRGYQHVHQCQYCKTYVSCNPFIHWYVS